MARPVCKATGKVEFTSKHAALDSLTGQLRSKSVRVYRCTQDPTHMHMTKTPKTKLKQGPDSR